MLMNHNPAKRLFPLETLADGMCWGTIETVPMVDRPQSLFSFLMAKLDWLHTPWTEQGYRGKQIQREIMTNAIETVLTEQKENMKRGSNMTNGVC